MTTRPQWPALALAAPLAGCAGDPSILDPAGPAADFIATLTWRLAVPCAVAWIATMAAFFFALRRGRRAARLGDPPMAEVSAAHDRPRHLAIAAAAIGTGLVLTVFVGLSYATDRDLLALERPPGAEITLIAHQWWWEIRYDDPDASKSFTTANEIHLPLGEPVKMKLTSPDVIHSFWIPNVADKRDVIPGRPNEFWITASRAGTWIGRCAEFCGLQHAHMEILAKVEDRAGFDAWRAAQALPARTPSNDVERHGEQVFSQGPCGMCHVVRGSPATGYSGVAPDLTHLKSRSQIAAGTLPNTKGHLGGWILDPQSHKPGARMPVNLLAPDDFQDLLAYLETLQ
jgi:cytochrome c oxidase subunit 2